MNFQYINYTLSTTLQGYLIKYNPYLQLTFSLEIDFPSCHATLSLYRISPYRCLNFLSLVPPVFGKVLPTLSTSAITPRGPSRTDPISSDLASYIQRNKSSHANCMSLITTQWAAINNASLYTTQHNSNLGLPSGNPHVFICLHNTPQSRLYLGHFATLLRPLAYIQGRMFSYDNIYANPISNPQSYRSFTHTEKPREGFFKIQYATPVILEYLT